MISRKFIFVVLILIAFASSSGARSVDSGENVSGISTITGTLSAMRNVLSVGNYNQSSGEILIPVMIDTTDRIGNLQFRLEYVGPCYHWISYPSRYEYVYGILNATEIIPGSLAEGSLIDWKISHRDYERGLGCNTSLVAGIVSGSGISGSGSMIAVRFNITGSKYYYETYTSFYSSFLNLLDVKANRVATFEPINVSVRNGLFTLKNDAGDCNGDGRITSADSLLALKRSVEMYYYYPACDMDGNRRVETVDAARILKMALDAPAPVKSAMNRSG